MNPVLCDNEYLPVAFVCTAIEDVVWIRHGESRLVKVDQIRNALEADSHVMALWRAGRITEQDLLSSKDGSIRWDDAQPIPVPITVKVNSNEV